jgi:C4-dicarboxylate-binding protein DctP
MIGGNAMPAIEARSTECTEGYVAPPLRADDFVWAQSAGFNSLSDRVIQPSGDAASGHHALTRRSVIAAALAAPSLVRAAAPIQLRVSVETPPTHGRTNSAADFCRKVEDASKGAIKTELFHSGQLFTDQNVVTALVQNQLEMSIPGTWGLAGFVPSVDVSQLPVMYARPVEAAHRVIDGKTGQMINAEIAGKLRMRVLGRWLDLGFENWYATTKRLTRLDDLTGMKIRNSGGAGKAWRTRFLGAIPNTTPMPNVALALSQGTFDGLITTNETAAAGSLWDSHVHYVLEDHQTFSFYVPLVAGSFWQGLSPAHQALLTDVWESSLAGYRTNMAAAQVAAREKLLAHGMVISVPGAAQTDSMRVRMLAEQDGLVKQWRITPAVAAQALADAG